MELRYHVNLASEPFRRDRPMLAASIALSVLLAGLLALLISIYFAERGQMADTRRSIAQLETQLRAMTTEQGKLEGTLRRPANAEVLDRSVFLNTLIYRKGISWTRMFDDLETVMPHDVRLIQIRPQVDVRNDVQLDMVVGAESGQPVIEMLKRLAASPLFGAPQIHTRMPATQSEPLLRYRISVNYAQKL